MALYARNDGIYHRGIFLETPFTNGSDGIRAGFDLIIVAGQNPNTLEGDDLLGFYNFIFESGSDRFSTGDGNDSLAARPTPSSAFVGPGTVDTGDGNDTVQGGLRGDVNILLGTGDDTLIVDKWVGSATANGGNGTDVLRLPGEVSNYVITKTDSSSGVSFSRDGFTLTTTEFENFSIGGVNPFNQPPTATGETVSTSKNTAVTVELADNVLDAETLTGATLKVISTSNGTVAATAIDQDAR
ncbi:MAG TPA: hypothetical protein VEZ50_20615, partial [Nodosilinea sp.]|nr:hypothetical protein [Nodosilinea sp.]